VHKPACWHQTQEVENIILHTHAAFPQVRNSPDIPLAGGQLASNNLAAFPIRALKKMRLVRKRDKQGNFARSQFWEKAI